MTELGPLNLPNAIPCTSKSNSCLETESFSEMLCVQEYDEVEWTSRCRNFYIPRNTERHKREFSIGLLLSIDIKIRTLWTHHWAEG